ncbi:hypothetical protein [Streptomyces sp. NPDC093676]|uniref:hypothetical protein n=1 Tax=Streptomyces sp. NPDC093676 TaxID=3366050 RepID=UPI003822F507
MRNGAVLRMKSSCAPGPDDHRIHTPRWALEEAGARIGALGVRVVGDLSLLAEAPSGAHGQPGPPAPGIAPEVAAQALYGALAATAALPGAGTVRSVHRTSSRELLRVLGHRALRRMRRR